MAVVDRARSGRNFIESLPAGSQSVVGARRELNPADVVQAASAYSRAVSNLPAPLRQAGEELFANLASTNWQMEWGLPRWLAESRGLPQTVCARLVEANVLGLGYVRLADDGADGQTGSLDLEETRRLADSLYPAAIAVYEDLIGPNPWFWQQLERFLTEWRSAGLQVLSVDVLDANHEGLQGLARLGAPLQICVAAVCALAGQEEHLARLAAPVNSYLVASVLIDHLCDWREDLRAGRPNLLVRSLLGEQMPGIPIDESQLRMAEAMLQPGRVNTYLKLAAGELRDAISASRRERLDGLADYLGLFEEETRQTADYLVGEIRSLLRQAAEMLFSH